MSFVVSLLQDLISIPSVNPDFDPKTAPDGEFQMVKFIKELLSPYGFQCHFEYYDPQKKGRPNLIAKAPFSGSEDLRPRILLGPHLDTVSIEGMEIDPFTPELRDQKVWGRGSSDTKGPMAAMLTGLINNASALSTLPVAVDFIGFCGEESGQPGSRFFAQHHANNYQFALIGEPTDLQVVHCSKGALWATLSAEGLAAHSSQPHLGRNAILTLTQALHTLLSHLTPFLEKNTHPILGQSTINVGMISGGTQPNIVPDHAQARIDLRTVPTLLTNSTAYELIESLLETHQLPLTLSHSIENPPMYTPCDHPWIQSLLAITPSLKTLGAPWFSDAAHLSAAGLPSICLGPGSIDQAHTQDEFISIQDLEEGADFFTHLIKNLHHSSPC